MPDPANARPAAPLPRGTLARVCPPPSRPPQTTPHAPPPRTAEGTPEIGTDDYDSRKPRTDFFRLPAGEDVHLVRRREILKKYPEIEELYKPDVMIFFQACGVVVAQMALSRLMADKTWWFTLLCGWLFGAFANQNLFLAIHEYSHGNAFGPTRKTATFLASLFANTPCVVPMATTFRKYHLEHHTQMHVEGVDVDVPVPAEGTLLGSLAGKATWVVGQIVAYAVRPLLVAPKAVGVPDLINVAWVVAVDLAVLRFWGLQSFLYLVYSSFLGGGMHPMAAHFISEHYVFVPGQETYSYYGPLNWVTYHVGFHIEHHDFPRIPGIKLPLLHKICPEYYRGYYHHTSWVWVIWKYITCPAMGPFARYQRPAAPQAVKSG